METNQTDLAPAIQKLLDAGKDMAHESPLGVHAFEVDDKGEKAPLRVAVIEAQGGAHSVVSLLDHEKAARHYAREQRLLYASGPDRREGVARMQALDSFIAHVGRFKDADSVVWADPTARVLLAVLDYNRQGAEGATRWGKHRSVYACPLSEAWKAWGGTDGLDLDQDEFVALLDGRDRELAGGTLPSGKAAPDPATLITIAANLETFSGNKTKRERDPNTGRMKLAYSNESGFVGELMMPPSFLVSIPVFQDIAPAVYEVRVRPSVEDGAAHFAVSLHGASDILRDAFLALCKRVGDETGLPVFQGSPESGQ